MQRPLRNLAATALGLGLAAVVVTAPAAGADATETGARGGAAAELTLEEAIRTALDGNLRLGVAAARRDAAAATAEEARTYRLPRIELQETLMRTTNPVYVFGNLLGQETFGASNFAIDKLNNPDPLNNFHTLVRVTQPVWTGGRIEGGIAAAESMVDSAEAAQERTRQEVAHQVIDAYTGAVLAARHRAVAGEILETARAHVKLVSDLSDAGLVVASDLLQARVRASEVEEMVIRADAAVAVSTAALNLAMGRDQDTPIRLPADVAAGAGGDEEDLDELLGVALARRPDLRSVDRRVEAAEHMVDVTRAGALPNVGVMGSFEANDADFIGADGTNWTLALVLQYSPMDGFAAGARRRRAERQRDEAETMRGLLEQGISLEVRRAWHETRAARQRLEQADLAVGMAEESLRIVEDRYREGLVTLTELLDAEAALSGAKLREVAAHRDLLLSRATLDLAVGRL